jgi:predicted deacylase
MLVEMPARGIRVGGLTIPPGEARTLAIQLPGHPGEEMAIPAWVAVGQKGGPRVSVIGAPSGFEVTAALAASELAGSIDPAALAGSLVVVPVFRPGGQFSVGGRPLRSWQFPGDAGGSRRARDAFTLFAELAVGSTVLMVLGSPPPGRRGVLTVRANLADPRTRRLALQTGAAAALSVGGAPGSLTAAAAEAGSIALELRAAGPPGGETSDAEDLVAAVRSVLIAVGVFVPNPPEQNVIPAPPSVPAVIEHTLAVRAPLGGLLEASISAGQHVRKGAVMARVIPPLGGKPVEVVAPKDGIVLESSLRSAERKAAKLFVLGPVARTAATRRVNGSTASAASKAESGQAAAPAAARARDNKLRVGWVEHVSLPNLGISRLKAKIDTGARTSALHVASMRTVDTTGGPQRKPILEILVPAGGPRGSRQLKVRATVREYVVVRDTSGRMERRPVIETALQLGPFKKRVLVTLTNRGDMLFPMLIGRTALGAGVTVDPSRRYLIPS